VTSFLWTASPEEGAPQRLCVWAPVAAGQALRELRLYTSTASNRARLRLGPLGFGCPAAKGIFCDRQRKLLTLTKTTRCDKGINTRHADSAQDFEFTMCVDPAAENSGRLGQSDPP